MALLVKVDGSQEEIELPKEGVLNKLYSLLDCDMVELLPLCEGSDTVEGYEGIMSDEEARLTDKEPNVLATKMSGRAPHSPMFHILGDCVFFKEGEIT